MIMKTMLRFTIIIFWIGLIFLVLYFPQAERSKHKNSLNIFAWGDILDPAVIAKFERESGIKIHLNFYASNEEMLVKLKATEGKGYDLIIPSDYSVDILIKEGLLKKIQKDKLDFFQKINPKLLNHYFDPDNDYSLPFAWEIFVLGIDKNFFENQKILPSWKLLFDEKLIHYKITMTNDPIQAILFSSFYLYGHGDRINDEEFKNVISFLIKHKNYVNAYAEFRADYFLATHNSAVVVSSTSYIQRTMQKFPFVDFIVPKEGTFITIENICLPQASEQEDLTYQLINFLYQESSMKAHFRTYGTFPAIPIEGLQADTEIQSLMDFTNPYIQKLHFIRPIANQDKLRDAWVQIKTSYEN